MKKRKSGCVRKRASDLHLLLIILLAPSLVIAPSDITHSRPHFDYRWESVGGGQKLFKAKMQKGTTDLFLSSSTNRKQIKNPLGP